MKYHMRESSVHGSVLENNEQPFEFTVKFGPESPILQAFWKQAMA